MMLGGMRVRASTPFMASSACPSEYPGARLNETVTAGNCPCRLTESASLSVWNCVNALSGTGMATGGAAVPPPPPPPPETDAVPPPPPAPAPPKVVPPVVTAEPEGLAAPPCAATLVAPGLEVPSASDVVAAAPYDTL